MRIVGQEATLLSITPNADKIIERAGRVCYKSEGNIKEGSSNSFIRSLIKRGHESVLEHASATYMFTTDRGVTHELVRHRIASFSQESTRYCNYSKDNFESGISVILPPNMNDEGMMEWFSIMEHSERVYLNMLKSGITPEIARSVLPNALKSDIVMTANIREWRHIFKLRLHKSAHPQIRDLMSMAVEKMNNEYPVFVEDIMKSDLYIFG
jgi:thymidylate synthase (FAD)